jgi:hypothetical protein
VPVSDPLSFEISGLVYTNGRIIPLFFGLFFAILAIFCPFVDHFRFFLNLYDIAGQA